MTDELRIASNESLFRQVNDRVEELAVSHDFGPWRLGLVCECPSLDCAASIELTIVEYEELRAHPSRFAIAPEHDVPQLEMVVAKNEYHWAVERTGTATETATAEAATEIYLNEPPETG